MAIWHEGELAVQERAGVRRQADELTSMYRSAIEPGMVGFLAQQRFAVVSTVDSQGRTWVSPVAGDPGMLQVPHPTVIRIDSSQVETRLPVHDVAANSKMGMLVIDFVRRIRVRINGEASIEPGGSILVAIQQLYGNCSQYIQRRTVVEPAMQGCTSKGPLVSASLTESQIKAIRKSDTFFLGSVHAKSGADASHRGGLPGFVQADGPAHLSFPDYSGNNMFNTLGNIAVNPSVGMLFFDFETGNALQLTGKASVDWDQKRIATFKGASRVIEVAVNEVREVERATSLRYRFEAYSPFLTQE